MDPWGNASPLSDGNDAAMGRKDVMGRTDGRTPWEGRTDASPSCGAVQRMCQAEFCPLWAEGGKAKH